MPSASHKPLSSMELRVALLALGLGLLQVAVWLHCGHLEHNADRYSSLTRLIAFVVLVVIAMLKRERPNRALLLGGAAACLVAHALVSVFSFIVTEETTISALMLLSSLFEGLILALGSFAALAWIIPYPPFMVGIAISAGYLVANILYTAGFQLSLEAMTVVSLAFKTLGIAVVALATKGATADPTTACTTPRTGFRQHELVFLLVFVAFFLMVQGAISQVTGFAGTGEGSYFGMSESILCVFVRIMTLLLFLFLGKQLLRPEWLMLGCTILCCISMVAFLSQASGAGTAGTLLIGAIYWILQVVPVVLVVQRAGGDGHGYGVVCLALGCTYVNQITRFSLGLIGVRATGVGPEMVALIVLPALAILLAGFLVVYACNSNAPGDLREPLSAGMQSSLKEGEPTDTLMALHMDFFERFQTACTQANLSEREREVLFEAVHGYTIDAIADRLCLSRETVKTHLAKCYAKLGVNGKQAFLHLMDTGTPASAPTLRAAD